MMKPEPQLAILLRRRTIQSWPGGLQKHHVAIFPQENRGGTAGEVGEDQGCEEGSGLARNGSVFLC